MEQRETQFAFAPKELLFDLLQNLNLREREVLQRRYGLQEKAGAALRKETLERIGKDFGVTRERIRQIENAAIKKLMSLSDLQQKIDEIEKSVKSSLDYYGGIMAEDHLIESLWEEKPSALDQASFAFIIDNLLSDIAKHENDHVYPSWAMKSIKKEDVLKVISNLVDIINEHEEPIAHEALLERFQTSRQETMPGIHDRAVESHLRLSKKIKRDVFGSWGLAHWRVVSPKRMNDKIYLVLKKHNKPMHFTDIADAIDAMTFDSKKAHPPTIHNELILDKKRFVLVGRGIYALTEQGYKHGVVAEVIAEILKDQGAMTKEEIVDAVLAQRVVAQSTIYLALTNKDRFKKSFDGRYSVDVA